MSEVHRYKAVQMISEAGGRIGYDPHGPDVVMASAYDKIKAENSALRKILAEADGLIRGGDMAARSEIVRARVYELSGKIVAAVGKVPS